MMDRFLLFSTPRSGSTTLMHLLNCHPDIRCSHEPFNKDVPDFKPVDDSGMLEARLNELWEKYNGIKHVWTPLGWPFQRRSALNRQLLLRPGQRVILLHRRNLLQLIVSNHIGLQTRVFAIRQAKDRDRIAEFPLEPIKEHKVARMLFRWKRGINRYRKALARHEIEFLELAYEDLFGPDLTVEQKRKALNEVLRFLGRDPAAEGIDHERIDMLFDPARSKVNSADTYRLVPGIERIERLFRSRENGWLFKPTDRWPRFLRGLRGGGGG